MPNHAADSKGAQALQPYVTRLGAFAFAVGASIGWGAFMVTANQYLYQAGPLGSMGGLLIGAAVMLVIARNLAYMVRVSPNAGGVYAYVKTAFGYDQAFLISWFMSLTYLVLLWANAAAVPLFARYLVGDTFLWGRLYSFFGQDIYLGEILLGLSVLLACGRLCLKSRILAQRVMVGAVFVVCGGISVCLAGVLLHAGSLSGSFDPVVLPEPSTMRQVLGVAFLSPWAFVGFEGISHGAEEFRFPANRLLGILRATIVTVTLLYAFALMLSVAAHPQGYDSWLAYIRDLDTLEGIEGLPAFYAAYTYLGKPGVVILTISLLCLIVSSLVGNVVSLSRLFYALARDKVLSAKFAELSDVGIPERAVLLITGLSVPSLFVGRTAINSIVDVSIVGATLLYGFACASTLVIARRQDDRAMFTYGALGAALMGILGVCILVRSVISSQVMNRTSQLILIGWSVLGLLFFRTVMVRDRGRRFGKNLAALMVLVAFVFLFTMIWICEECAQTTAANLLAVRNHYASGPPVTAIADDSFLIPRQQSMMYMIISSATGVLGIFVVTLSAMLSNWLYVRRCEMEAERELGTVKTIAYTDPLTGVKSKHAYVEAESEYDKRIDQGRVQPFAIVVCDINGLKYVNDTFGHQAGDQHIQDASRLICSSFKHSPVYRMGGDEFVVLINGQDYAEREVLLADLNRVVEENITGNGVVISAGMSAFDARYDNSFHAVFNRADKLMYTRKQQLKSMGVITRA